MDGVAQGAQSFYFDLAYAPAGQLEARAQLFQRVAVAVVQAVAQFDHLSFALVEGLQGARDLIAQGLVGYDISGGRCPRIFQRVRQVILFVLD